MPQRSERILLLGMGNLLLGDEGVGVHAAARLAKMEFRKNVTVLDIGTAVLDALEAVGAADRIVIMDAVKAGCTPGTIYRIPLKDCLSQSRIASMHGFDIFRVMALAGRTRMPPVVVIGMEPAVIDWAMELSPELEKALPEYIDAVAREIEAECDLAVEKEPENAART